MSTSASTSIKSLRTSAVTLPRQLAPTVGPSPSGVIFRAGSLPAGCDADCAVGQAIVFGSLFFVENAGYRPADAPPVTRGVIMPFGRINAFVGLVEAAEQPTESVGSPSAGAATSAVDRITAYENFINTHGDLMLPLDNTDDLNDDAAFIQKAPSTVPPSEPESIL